MVPAMSRARARSAGRQARRRPRSGAGCRLRACCGGSRRRRLRRPGRAPTSAESSSVKGMRLSSTAGTRAHLRPSGGCVVAGGHAGLALAVVAEPARLQDRRPGQGGERGSQLRWPIDRRERGDRNAEPGDELLLDQSVLRHFEGLDARPHRHAGGEVAGGLHGHVLELEGHRVDACRELRRVRRNRRRRPWWCGSPRRRPGRCRRNRRAS